MNTFIKSQHDSRRVSLVTRACRIIEKSETMPPLEKLANQVGASSSHFHRVFKEITGLTPRQYAVAHRIKRTQAEINRGVSVTQAIYNAGYNSNGRFYENSNQVLGMTPTNYRNGGSNMQIHFAIGQCSLGAILVAQSERGICAIFLGDDPEMLARDLQDRFPHAELIGGDKNFEKVVAKVIGFVEAPQIGLDLPLDVRGTAFQQRVWQALREIPLGKTVTYTEIANRIGAPKSVRAVANACGSNKIAVAIPCHRVVRRDGNLSGYRWGVERKRALLDKEQLR
jgi:AraC family transcriptional regulator of adaptative response/methylated-DNA-[protein]-cysteine methyltransferase